MSPALLSRRSIGGAFRFRALLAAAIAFSISCGGGGDGGTITGPPTSTVGQVVISPANVSLSAGATHTFSVEVRSTQGAVLTGQNVVWTVSDTSVLAVAGSAVTAKRPGTANVLAQVGTTQGVATVVVTPVPVASVALTPATAALLVGQTVQLAAIPKDSMGGTLSGRTVTWSSSDTTRAIVNASGLVTARQPGAATMTAVSEGKSATAVLTITPVPVASVSVTPATASLLVGQTLQLAATAKDSAGGTLSGRTVAWNSSDTTRATVSGTGLVTARQPGTVTITAISEGKSATAAVTVVVPQPGTLTISASGMPSGTGLSVVVTDAAGVQQTRTLTVGGPLTISGLAPGSYSVRAQEARVTINEVPFAHLPSDAVRSVTVPNGGGATVDFAYSLSAGAVRLQVTGVPAGSQHQCQLMTLTSWSSFAWASNTTAPMPAGKTEAQVRCSEFGSADGSFIYDPTPASQAVTVPVSTTPVVVSVSYARRSAP